MAISEELATLTAHLKRNAPATDEQWQAFVAQIGFEPPPDYLDFMRQSDGGYGEGELLVFLHPLAEAATRGRDIELPDGVVVFGNDGGDVHYAFDGRNPKKVQIVEIDGSSEEKFPKLGATFTAALAKLRARREKADAAAAKKSKLPPIIPPAGPGQAGEVARIHLVDLDRGITAISFADDLSAVAITSGGSVEVWTASGGRRLARRDEAGEEFSGYGAAYFDRAGGRVLTFVNEGVLVWDAATLERRAFVPFNADYAGQARFFLPGGNRLAIMQSGFGLRMWDLAAGREVYTVTEKQYYYHPSARADGRVIALATRGAQSHLHVVHALDAATGARLAEIPIDGFHAPLTAFLPDGSVIAGGSPADGGGLTVFDPANGQVRRQFALGLGDASDGLKTLAAVPGPGTPPRILAGTSDWLALFDAADGRLIHRYETFIKGGAPDVLSVAPDGRTFATAGRHDLMIKDKAVVRMWAVPASE